MLRGLLGKKKDERKHRRKVRNKRQRKKKDIASACMCWCVYVCERDFECELLCESKSNFEGNLTRVSNYKPNIEGMKYMRNK